MAHRALVVEDDRAWRELLVEILEDLSFRTRVASDYETALEAIEEGPYDLALLDASLVTDEHDNQDGLRVLKQFRARYPLTPAILLTGYATVDLAVRALTAPGADELLRKEQFNRHRFQETVQRVLGATPAHATLRSSRHPGAGGGQRTVIDAHVLVVEDNPAWQSIYEELLGDIGMRMSVAVSYGEARGLLQREKFDAAVVDLKLASSTEPRENRDGFYLLRLVQEARLPTVVVSALGDRETIDRAYEEFDVFAFFDKEGFQRSTFLQTLRDGLARPAPGAATPDSDRAFTGTPLEEMTERQLEVLALLVQGKTNNEIASELIVSVNTVKKHVLAIFAVLGVNTRAAAAAVAARYGLK
jgi:DNA-binding NarL/FixJ family response regulator